MAGRGVDAARGLDPVQHGHRDVHDDDVRTQTRDEARRLFAVTRLGDDVEAGVQEGATKCLAQQLMIVGDDDGCHWATSSSTRTDVPRSGSLVSVTWAPTASARSRIPTSP